MDTIISLLLLISLTCLILSFFFKIHKIHLENEAHIKRIKEETKRQILKATRENR